MDAIVAVITDLLRSIAFFVDNIVYGFIPTLYSLITYLAQIDIFSSDGNIQALMTNIYSLLSVFMLFKISFSFLRFIIDPDSFSEESKGVGKLVSRVIVAVILLVTVPYIFNVAYNLQSAIVTSNIIGELILGGSYGNGEEFNQDESITLKNIFDLENNSSSEDASSTNENAKNLDSSAKDLQFLIFGAFFSINTDDDVFPDCKGSPIIGSNEMVMVNDGKCLESLATEFDTNDDLINSDASLDNYFITTDGDNRNFGELGDVLNWKINSKYVINYLPLISTITGIYLIFLLITFCISVSIRVIKLCFLQMLAPISIIMYIDPKESTANSSLGKWAKECGKTYASLFIRLATIFLVIRFISIISAGVFDPENGFMASIDEAYKMWVFVFLVIGGFAFAQQVPKMLENLLGYQSSGEFSLNPLKNITSNVAASALVGGAAGLAGGMAANALNAGYNFKKNVAKDGVGKTLFGTTGAEFRNNITSQNGLWNKTRAFAGGVAGGAATLARGSFANARSVVGGGVAGAVQSGYASKDGKIPEGIKTGHQKVISNREERDVKQAQDLNTRLNNVLTKFAGVKNEYGSVGAADKSIKDLREQLERTNQIQEQLSEIFTNKSISITQRRPEIDLKHITTVATNFNPNISVEEQYNRYLNENEGPILTRDEYNDLMNVRSNIIQAQDIERGTKKQISDLERASGIKSDDKK